eukprot:2951185-Lingulodinium_polyedra.AAC.1
MHERAMTGAQTCCACARKAHALQSAQTWHGEDHRRRTERANATGVHSVPCDCTQCYTPTLHSICPHAMR